VAVAIFDQLDFRSTSRNFRGGRLECWYGGGVLDLRDAVLAPEGATLQVRAVFGGGQILVPADWKVVSTVRGAGGLQDLRQGQYVLAGPGDDRGAAYVVYGGPIGFNHAPSISVDHKTATFYDTDGDKVTVKVSKGDVAKIGFDLIGTSTAKGTLVALHVPASLAGSDLTITAKPTADGGDGMVNLGFLDATGVDLGNVKIGGNVEHVVAGNLNTPGAAMKSFTVQSLGEGVLPERGVRLRVASAHERLHQPWVQFGEDGGVGHQLPFGYSTRRMWTGSVKASSRT
jgi:hypothetical protein